MTMATASARSISPAWTTHWNPGSRGFASARRRIPISRRSLPSAGWRARAARRPCTATTRCNADRLVEEAGAVVRAARDCGIALALSCPLLDTFTLGLWRARGVAAGPLRDGMGAAAAARSRATARSPSRSRPSRRSRGDMPANRSTSSSARSGRNGRATTCSKRSRRHPRARGCASTCICWKARASAAGSTGAFRTASSIISTASASCRRALPSRTASQLRPEECELLAERGVIVVSNPSANLRLRSGVAPVAQFRAAGLGFAFGLDGTGFDDDQDLWREMRLAWLLHGGSGTGCRRSRRPRSSPPFSTTARRSSTGRAGRDMVVIDYAALTAEMLFDDVDEARVADQPHVGTPCHRPLRRRPAGACATAP